MTPGVPVRYTVEAVWRWIGSETDGIGSRPGISSNQLTVTAPGPAPTGLRGEPAYTTPMGFGISWNAITGDTNLDRLVAYRVYVNDRFLTRVPARVGEADEGFDPDNAKRTGRIPLNINSEDYEEFFRVNPITPNMAFNVRVSAEWLPRPLDGVERPARTGLTSAPVTVRTTGDVPTGLEHVVSSVTEVELHWSHVNNALGYEIFVSDGRGNIPIDYNLPNPSESIGGLQPNTEYFVRVRAYWAFGDTGTGTPEPLFGNWSAAHRFRTSGPAPSTPTAATRLVSEGNSEDFFVELRWNFSWLGVNSGISGFLVYRNGVPHRFLRVNSDTDGNPTSPDENRLIFLDHTMSDGNISRINLEWRDHGVTPGIAVTYMVQAFWGDQPPANWDNPGNMQNFNGGGAISGPRSITPTGGAPSRVEAVSPTATTLAVRWNSVADVNSVARVHSYLVEVGREWKIALAGSGRLVSEPFTGLSPNTAYPVRVTVIWDGGRNPYVDCADCLTDIDAYDRTQWICECGWERLRMGRSATANLRTANPVPSTPVIRVGAPSGTGVRLYWNEVSEATGYFIYRDGEWIAAIGVSVRETGDRRYRFEDLGLTPGVSARYTVRAFWCEGNCGLEPEEHRENLNCVRVSTPSRVRQFNQSGAIPRDVEVIDREAMRFTARWRVPAALPNPRGATVSAYAVEIWHDGVNITGRVDILQEDIDRDIARNDEGTAYIVPATAAEREHVTFERLTPNTRYQVRVRAIWYALDSQTSGLERYRYGNFSGFVNANTRGDAPTRFERVPGSLTHTGVELRWRPVAGAVGYMVYRNSVPFNFIPADVFSSRNNTWLDDMLSPGIAVRYTVRAYWVAPNDNLTGGSPGNRTGVLTVTPPTAVPRGVTARAVTSSSVSVEWNPMAALSGQTTVGGFRVELLQGGRVVETIDRRNSVARIVTFTGIDPNTAYRARVIPIWDAGLRADSDCATCQAATYASADITCAADRCGWIRFRTGRAGALVNVRTTGAAPGNLRIAPGSLTHTGVRLTWAPVRDRYVAGYIIYRNGVPFDFISADNFRRNNNTWEDPTLRPRVQARYTVRALWGTSGTASLYPDVFTPDVLERERLTQGIADSLRPGNTSRVLNVTPLGAAPGNVRATVNSPTMLTVTWNAVAGAAGFVVRVEHPTSSDPAMSFERAVPAGGFRAQAFSGLQPNTRYRVTVAGVWDAGMRANSDCATCLAVTIVNNVGKECSGDGCDWIRFREGVSSRMLNATATTGPAPARLRAIGGTLNSTSVHLTWNLVADSSVTGYLVSKDGVPIDFVSTESLAGNNNTWTYHGLRPGVATRFTVQACWSDGATFEQTAEGRVWNGLGRPGRVSNALRVTAPHGGRPAPAGVRATVSNPTEITVTWNDLAGVNGYRVELLLGGRVIADSGLILRAAARTHTFGIEHVAPNTQYQVRVVGVWDVGARPHGAPEWQWPLDTHRDGRASGLVRVRTTGPAPTGLRLALAADRWALTSTSEGPRWNVRLAWNPPANADAIGVQGYLIFRNNIPIAHITADEFRAAENTWVDNTGLAPRVRVTYSVQATWGEPPRIDPIVNPEDFDERGRWIPNGKPGIRSGNLRVTPPQP